MRLNVMSECTEDRLLLEQDSGQAQCWPVGKGLCAVVSRRAPDKSSVNQDGALVMELEGCGMVLAVADGAGGARAGEQASRTALTELQQELRTAQKQSRPLREAVLAGIDRANQAVLALGLGAVTTLVVTTLEGKEARCFHVGDSMAMVVGQRGKLKLLTVSHSPVGYAVESGFMDADEAMLHEERHLVSNVVGSSDMRVEMSSPLRLAPHDTLLLASDGLFDNLQVEEISRRIRCGPLPDALNELMADAWQRMHAEEGVGPCKPDDFTALVFRLTH